jgi:hypothetical protein
VAYKGNPNYAMYAVSESEIWADLFLDERDVDQFRVMQLEYADPARLPSAIKSVCNRTVYVPRL